MSDVLNRLRSFAPIGPIIRIQAADEIESLRAERDALKAEVAALKASREGWKLVPDEPTPEIIAAAALAVWPVASKEEIELARCASKIVLMSMDQAPGTTLETLAASLATMAPSYRAMLAAAPACKEPQK